MFILNGFELIKSLNTGQILTGLDLGDKTIGIAISDNNFIIGSPLKTIIRKGTASDTKILNSLFKEYNVGGIVLGWPINLDSSENERTRKTRDFGEKLYIETQLEIYLQDERYSSDVVFKEMNKNISKKKIKKYIDKSAAAYILQGFLDKFSNIN
ncbi:MAG: putative pre-16S rRNA nuclease [Alphaproteobacteria bacterium MarineAlpha5_Bin12]|nr:Holliday junction resolvase RuvX [Pelagibacteraceae bacterium]PPR41786.1 MAG: putative pre-16S rRNA nuclease [Alphaproteobacteria bacterium MarineAlpha5_Bin12]|tara:strand:+ start:4638 stop:5102 length:465 start_codon:yes stop_codon:yes gene_type:complete